MYDGALGLCMPEEGTWIGFADELMGNVVMKHFDVVDNYMITNDQIIMCRLYTIESNKN